jgi:hypothetical protein
MQSTPSAVLLFIKVYHQSLTQSMPRWMQSSMQAQGFLTVFGRLMDKDHKLLIPEVFTVACEHTVLKSTCHWTTNHVEIISTYFPWHICAYAPWVTFETYKLKKCANMTYSKDRLYADAMTWTGIFDFGINASLLLPPCLPVNMGVQARGLHLCFVMLPSHMS